MAEPVLAPRPRTHPPDAPARAAWRIGRPKDLVSAVVFLVTAAFFMATTLITLDLGTLYRMGPGFFPLVLAALLGVLALALAAGSVTRGAEPAQGPILADLPVRGLICVLLAPVLFALTVRDLGFAPAVGLASLVGAAASRRMSLLGAVTTACTITLFCIGVFVYGLQLPLPLIGPVFG